MEGLVKHWSSRNEGFKEIAEATNPKLWDEKLSPLTYLLNPDRATRRYDKSNYKGILVEDNNGLRMRVPYDVPGILRTSRRLRSARVQQEHLQSQAYEEIVAKQIYPGLPKEHQFWLIDTVVYWRTRSWQYAALKHLIKRFNDGKLLDIPEGDSFRMFYFRGDHIPQVQH